MFSHCIPLPTHQLTVKIMLMCPVNRYAKQRKSFGQPISSLYAIQEKLSTMSVKVDAARLLIYKAAMLKDAGKSFIKDAAQAKLYASEAATWCSHQAIQVCEAL